MKKKIKRDNKKILKETKTSKKKIEKTIKHREKEEIVIKEQEEEIDNNLPRVIDQSSLATHVPLLARVFDLSQGDILEVGTGYFSTLLLHWLAEMTQRHVYSYENRDNWYKRAQTMNSTYHHIVYCKDWDSADFDQRHWGLVFIDHGPDNRRPVEIERLKDRADYIVIHDTDEERDGQYGYSKVLPQFKYRYDYKKIWPFTSVVSNFKNLDDIK